MNPMKSCGTRPTKFSNHSEIDSMRCLRRIPWDPPPGIPPPPHHPPSMESNNSIITTPIKKKWRCDAIECQATPQGGGHVATAAAAAAITTAAAAAAAAATDDNSVARGVDPLNWEKQKSIGGRREGCPIVAWRARHCDKIVG